MKTNDKQAAIFGPGITRIYEYFVIIIVIIAASLRLFHLSTWSYWIEEYHSIHQIKELNSLADITDNLRPLFFLLAKPEVILLGMDEWSTRLVSVFIGVITLPIFYLFTKRIIGPKEAILSTILLAISPWHIFWSQNFRFYTLLLLLYSIAYFSFFLAIEKDDYRYLLLSVACFLLGLITHGISLLIVLVFILYFFLVWILGFERPPGMRVQNLAPFVLLPLIALVVYSVISANLLGGVSIFENLVNRVSKASPNAFIGYDSPFLMMTSTIYYIGTPLAFLALPGSYYLIKEKNRFGLFLSIGAYLPLIIVMALTTVAATSNRYVFMTLPNWVILSVISVGKIVHYSKQSKLHALWLLGLIIMVRDPASRDIFYYSQRSEFRLILVLIALLATVYLATRFFAFLPNHFNKLIGSFALLILFIHPLLMDTMYFLYQGGHRDNWKAAALFIKENKRVGDRVYSHAPVLPSYYMGESVEDLGNIDIASLDLTQRFWIVEEFGTKFSSLSGDFPNWASTHCRLLKNWDQFVAGRLWKMRVHLCSADSS